MVAIHTSIKPRFQVVKDEGNPKHLGTVAWQRRKEQQARARRIILKREARYSPAAELKRLYRHYRYFESKRVGMSTSNPEHDIDPTLLIALELFAALPYLTHTRRLVFEACIIGRTRVPNLITHRYEWKWLEAPLSLSECADLLETTEPYIRNLIDRALATLTGRIYETLTP